MADEVRERMARIAASLTRATSGRATDLDRVRRIVAGAASVPAPASEPSIAVRAVRELDDALTAAPDIGVSPDELAELIGEPVAGPTATPGLEAPEGYDVVVRSVPFRTSTNPLATPDYAAGRQIERTIGPIRDASGRDIWIDILFRSRPVGVLRTVGADPILLVPIRGLLHAGDNYRLAAGSVWILASLLASEAPAGAYCGIRITGGRLRLSAGSTVSGGNLVIGAGTIATLEIKTDPQAAGGAAGAPGADGRAAKADVPANARFVFEAAGGRLDAADDAAMTAFGTALKLTHRPGAGHLEPLINRVLLGFDTEPATFGVRRCRSELFTAAGKAPVVDAGWALSLTIAAPASLGVAAGAGGLAAELDDGLEGSWRGLAGGPVPFKRSVALAEPGRLELAAARAGAPAARQSLALWNETGEPGRASQVELAFPADEPVRFFSESGTVDGVTFESDLDATLDRPVRIDGSRVPLRSKKALTSLWQLPAGFGLLIAADVKPQPRFGQTTPARPSPIALTNALIHVSGPSAFVVTGAWNDPAQLASGGALILFGVRRIIPSLRDPYATNLAAPIGRRSARLEARDNVAAYLIAVTTWPDPARPTLALTLLPASGQGILAVSPSTAAVGPQPAPAAFLASGLALETQAEDRAAEAGLRSVFEGTAGSTREGLVLVDVSSNIDQFGVGFGVGREPKHTTIAVVNTGLPISIAGLDLSAPARNLRVLLLPQFQWEPVINLPNPNVPGFYPPTLASADDGGPTVLGTASVTLVPFAPETVTKVMLEEFAAGGGGIPIGAKFTLPFGMKAAARLQPFDGNAARWATVVANRPATADARFVGGLQIATEAFPDKGPQAETPSFPGAAWQTRNGVDPVTGNHYPLSVLSASLGNPGVEAFFNQEMGPGRPAARVPVTRIDFSGYGGSTFSNWANPNAVASVSQVRFDVIVARTAYEVIQVASILYPWAVPVVRTITLERRKEATVVRYDSGWVATGPGLYDYPDPDLANGTPPANWTEIKTHPGVVKGAWNVRRIRETGRVLSRSFLGQADPVELLEVRFDADFEIEGVVQGQGSTGLVTGRDQVGFVQRSPQFFPLVPEHLAAMMDDEGPFGGQIDCIVDVGGSGQLLTVKRVDVAPSPQPVGGPPQFAAAVRGAVALPKDGQWSAVRHDLATAEPAPVDTQSGVPLIRKGVAPAGPTSAEWYRLAEPVDLLREDTPTIEFGLVQGADAHRVLFPRPRIKQGDKRWSSTEKPALAETYTLSLGVGVFPARDQCLVGADPWGFDIGGDGRFTLLPAPTMSFDAPPAVADRLIVDGAAFKIRTRYEKPMDFTLDPSVPKTWGVGGGTIFTTMDLGPFTELIGIRHGFTSAAGEIPAFETPEMVYPPALAPVVEILEFLASILGIDNVLAVEGFKGSFKFKAVLTLPIENPKSQDRYIDLGAMEVKGKLSAGVASAPNWNGFIKIELGARVPVIPPIMGGGEVGVELEGNALTEQKVTIEVKWSASIGKSLGPIEVKGSFTFGIQVIASSTGDWQIGLLVAISASADIWIAKITIKIELLAAIKVLGNGTKQALGQAKFAAEISICWFLTVSVEYSLEYSGAVSI